MRVLPSRLRPKSKGGECKNQSKYDKGDTDQFVLRVIHAAAAGRAVEDRRRLPFVGGADVCRVLGEHFGRLVGEQFYDRGASPLLGKLHLRAVVVQPRSRGGAARHYWLGLAFTDSHGGTLLVHLDVSAMLEFATKRVIAIARHCVCDGVPVVQCSVSGAIGRTRVPATTPDAAAARARRAPGGLHAVSPPAALSRRSGTQKGASRATATASSRRPTCGPSPSGRLRSGHQRESGQASGATRVAARCWRCGL